MDFLFHKVLIQVTIQPEFFGSFRFKLIVLAFSSFSSAGYLVTDVELLRRLSSFLLTSFMLFVQDLRSFTLILPSQQGVVSIGILRM